MDEYDTLRQTDFDARAFLKRFLGEEDYMYLHDFAPGDLEQRRDFQDQQLQQLVLSHLSVFVQCKDAIEAVYSSDKGLFTGEALKAIVQEFLLFRQEQVEPLMNTPLTLDSGTNHLRNVSGVAARSAAVLDLPFHAVRAACQGEFDECTQVLKSAVSFLDSAKFQRYEVLRGKMPSSSSSASSPLLFGTAASATTPTASLNSDQLVALDGTMKGGLGGSASSADGGSTSGSTAFGGRGSSLQSSLQPFEIVHRVFAQWLTASEDSLCFALFAARHTLAADFTLLPTTPNAFSEARGGGNSSNNNKNSSSSSSNSSSNRASGVRLVELEDLFIQIVRLLDLLAIVRLERHRLLGGRAVDVADAARTASCSVVMANSSQDDSTKKSKDTTATKGEASGDNSNDKKPAASSGSSSRTLQVTSREAGVARYFAAVLATGATSMRREQQQQQQQRNSKSSAAAADQGGGGGDADSSNNQKELFDPSRILRTSNAFTSIFSDPRPMHPLLVFCHLFERSIHVTTSNSVRRLVLDVRSTEISIEQQQQKNIRNEGGGGAAPATPSSASSSPRAGAAASSVTPAAAVFWWHGFVPQQHAEIRLVTVPPDEMAARVPNRCIAAAHNLVELMTEGLPAHDCDALHAAVFDSVAANTIFSDAGGAASSTRAAHGNDDGATSAAARLTSLPWLSGKNDDDAAWFAAQCEENLQSFRLALSCVAPALSPCGAANTRHQSMNLVANALGGIIARDALRGVTAAWRRLTPVLRTGALCKDYMEWERRYGTVPKQGNDGGQGNNNNTNNNDVDDETDEDFASTATRRTREAMKSSNSGGTSDKAKSINLKSFLNGGVMYSRLLPSLATFSTKVPQRVLDELGGGKGIDTARDLLIAACRHDMASWLRIIGKLLVALFAELVQADITGFFVSVASLNMSPPKSFYGSTTSTSASSSAASSTTSEEKFAAIESELATTVRRWSSVVNGIVRETLELQRCVAQESELEEGADDPFSPAVAQRHVLSPMSSVLCDGLRRVYFLASRFRYGVKSASWVLREMAVFERTSSSGSSSATSSASLGDAGGNNLGGGASFGERLEAFVAENRQSLAPRFGAPSSSSSGGGDVPAVAAPCCSNFAISVVNSTSQLLTVCAPLLRVVAGFETTLCALVSGTITDHLSLLRSRAATAAQLQRVTPDCRDIDAASWLVFLSAAPFDSTSSSSSSLIGGSSAVSSTSSGPTTSAEIRQLVCREYAATMRAASRNTSSNNTNINNIIDAATAPHLLSFHRLALAEAAVTDAIALAIDLVPRIIADNVAATLTFRATLIDDNTVPWLSAFFMQQQQTASSAIDSSLSQFRAMFNEKFVSESCGLTSAAVGAVYRAAAESLVRLTTSKAQAALEAWGAGLRRSQGVIDAAVVDATATTSATTAPSSPSTSATEAALLQRQQQRQQHVLKSGVSSSVDVFALLCQTLAAALRWRARFLAPLLSLPPTAVAAGASASIASSSLLAVWEGVVGTAVRWVALEVTNMGTANNNSNDTKQHSSSWHTRSLHQLSQSLLHLVSQHSDQVSELQRSGRSRDWATALQQLIEATSSLATSNTEEHRGNISNQPLSCCCIGLVDQIDGWATSTSSSSTSAVGDPRAAHLVMSLETLDDFLRRDMPLEYEAFFGGGGGSATAMENWWEAESRGAQRREQKLQVRRGARVAAAQALMLQQQHQQQQQQADAMKEGGARAGGGGSRIAQLMAAHGSNNNNNDDDEATETSQAVGGGRRRRRRGAAAAGNRLGRLGRKAEMQQTTVTSIANSAQVPSTSAAAAATPTTVSAAQPPSGFSRLIARHTAAAEAMSSAAASTSAAPAAAATSTATTTTSTKVAAPSARPSAVAESSDQANNNDDGEVRGGNPFARRRHHGR